MKPSERLKLCEKTIEQGNLTGEPWPLNDMEWLVKRVKVLTEALEKIAHTPEIKSWGIVSGARKALEESDE